MSFSSPSPTIIVGVDFGTTFTGVSFLRNGDGKATPADVHVLKNWPSGGGEFKVPSRIAYFQDNRSYSMPHLLWGFEIQPGMIACSWTKLLLDRINRSEFDDEALEAAAGLGIFHVPQRKDAVDVVADYLHQIRLFAVRMLKQSLGEKAMGTPVEYWFSFPATWSEQAKRKTKDAATRAGLGQRSQDTLTLLTESEAAAEAVFAWPSSGLKLGDGVMICDLGGGTVDVASYLITGTNKCDVRTIASVKGGQCGGAAIDSRLYQLVHQRLGDVFDKVPRSMLAPGSEFMCAFERAKHEFGPQTMHAKTLLPLKLRRLPQHTAVYDAALQAIPISGGDIKGMFDPVIWKIIKMMHSHLNDTERECGRPVINRIILVGGLSTSVYVQEALRSIFHRPDQVLVLTPENPQLAVTIGASLRAHRGGYPAAQRCPQHYGFEDHSLSTTEVGFQNTRCVAWIMNKSELYPPNYHREHVLSRFHPLEGPPALSIDVYSCEMTFPPMSLMHESVKLAGQIPVNVSQLNLNQIPPMVINCQTVYRLDFSIRTFFDPSRGSLHFNVQILGQVVGTLVLKVRGVA